MDKLKSVAFIAARLNSKRLPQKALVDIEGLPMFVHTCKRARLSKTISEVYLATDSEAIARIAMDHHINVIMTATYHTNSSERIAEACKNIDCDIVVNIQGDEPLVNPVHIDRIVSSMYEDKSIEVSMGITKFTKKNSLSDIKAVLDRDHNILFASRNDIPCYYLKSSSYMWKLCFIVPFRKSVVKKYLEWTPTPLELEEDNHFLRLIENGIAIKAIEIDDAKISVDTAEGLEEIKILMKKDRIKYRYL